MRGSKISSNLQRWSMDWGAGECFKSHVGFEFLTFEVEQCCCLVANLDNLDFQYFLYLGTFYFWVLLYFLLSGTFLILGTFCTFDRRSGTLLLVGNPPI